jgi:hypothetical protein
MIFVIAANSSRPFPASRYHLRKHRRLLIQTLFLTGIFVVAAVCLSVPKRAVGVVPAQAGIPARQATS